jgi:hypothetical protein
VRARARARAAGGAPSDERRRAAPAHARCRRHRRRRAPPPPRVCPRAGSLGRDEFRAALGRYNIRVSEKEFGLLMRELNRHSKRADERIEYATFGALLGRQ